MRNQSSSFEKQLERLKLATKTTSDTALAKKLGLKQGSISGAKQKKKIPPAWVVSVSTDFGVSADWLLFGEAPMKRGEGVGEGVGIETHCPLARKDGECDVVMVPKVRARLSAGTGSLETSDVVNGHYAFRSDWLRSKGRASRMVLMDITGDSMEPDIKDRDMVLIDESQTDVIPGAVFAIGLDDEVLIKYIDKEPGLYILRSANSNYRPIPIDLKDESLNVRIIGRVIWWCREAR